MEWSVRNPEQQHSTPQLFVADPIGGNLMLSQTVGPNSTVLSVLMALALQSFRKGVFPQPCLQIPGIEPANFHIQSGCSTAEPRPFR